MLYIKGQPKVNNFRNNFYNNNLGVSFYTIQNSFHVIRVKEISVYLRI